MAVRETVPDAVNMPRSVKARPHSYCITFYVEFQALAFPAFLHMKCYRDGIIPSNDNVTEPARFSRLPLHSSCLSWIRTLNTPPERLVCHPLSRIGRLAEQDLPSRRLPFAAATA